jgi:hypothetical protein
MDKLKCSKCKESAHIIVKKKAYCIDCMPKPIVIKEKQPEPLPSNYFKPLAECMEKKKSWRAKIVEFFDDRRSK